MIDDVVFKNTWALLCDRFGKTPSTPLMIAYYETLSPVMSTEQFRAAAQHVFENREFFPRPVDFIVPTQLTVQQEALTQWEQVHDMMRGFGSYSSLTAEAQRVVRMLGGEQKLRMTNMDAVQYVRRDFMELYGDTVEIARREAGNRIEPTRESLQITAAIMRDAGRDQH